MSLADQSQQWYPTSVKVTVLQARNLRVKGKNGTNDAYAIMQVAKDKFSTSVAEKCASPEWKEEATFELPLFHHGNAERCTLYVTVMHRAVGLDKQLGQAAINLLELEENKTRNKSEWFRLLGKSGKQDKERGEVLVDIQFLRNNMTASMFDLSGSDKPRSRVGKLKDKLRGKKRDGLSDSASAIVPSFTQVLTDSEGEAEDAAPDPGKPKKSSKLKSLFGTKSNLQRNVSQSMSTLGHLPETDSTLGSSHSSGLNVESPEGKKKFKFLTHKRTDSSDSKTSQGPFSMLGRSKHTGAEQSNLCINGSHVYAEEPEAKSSRAGSSLSLNSSGLGSLEDLRRVKERNNSDTSMDSIKAQQEENKQKWINQQEEEERVRQEEEEKKRLERVMHEKEERRRWEEARKAEELKRLEEARKAEEQKRLEEARKAEEQKRLEEARKAEEQKRLEEARKTEELKRLEEAKKVEELKRLEEAKKAEELKLKEEARKAEELKLKEEARKAEELKRQEAKKAEELKLKEEARKAEELKRQEAKKAEELKLKEEARKAEELKLKEEARKAEELKLKEEARKAEELKRQEAKKAEAKELRYQKEVVTMNNPFMDISSKNPFEDSLMEVSSKNPFEKSLMESQQEDIHTLSAGLPSRSTKVSAVKPRLVSSPTADSSTERRLLSPASPSSSSFPSVSVSPGYSPSRFPDQFPDEPVSPPLFPIPARPSRSPLEGQASMLSGEKKRHAPSPPGRQDSSENKSPPAKPAEEEVRPSTLRRPLPAPRSLLGKTSEALDDGPEKAEGSWWRQGKRSAPALPGGVAVFPNVKGGQTVLPEEKPLEKSGSYKWETPDEGTGEVLLLKPRQREVCKESGMVPLRTEESSAHEDRSAVIQRAAADEVTNVLNAKEGSADMALETLLKDNQALATSDAGVRDVLLKGDHLEEGLSRAFSSKGKYDEPVTFPSGSSMSKNTLEEPEQTFVKKDLVTGGPKKEDGPIRQGMIWDDTKGCFPTNDSLFRLSQFTSSNSADLQKPLEKDKLEEVSMEAQTKKKRAPLPPVVSARGKGKTESTSLQDQVEKSALMGRESSQQESMATNLLGKPRSQPLGREAQQAENPFTSPSSTPSSFLASPSPSKSMVGEDMHAVAPSGGRTQLQARVLPTEAQRITLQHAGDIEGSGGKGAGPTSNARRRHPVKPLNASEGIAVGPGASALVDTKEPESSGSGPYSQLTKEELIALVVKQQAQLLQKDQKVQELEEYIDNLLVRVIEEQPSILMSMNALKKAG